MQTEITIRITLKNKDMSKFLMRHTYTRFGGIFGVFMSTAALLALLIFWSRFMVMQRVVLFVLGLLFTVVEPWMLWNKGKKQLKQEIFREPFLYRFSEKGIEVSQGEYKEENEWSTVRKTVFTKDALYIYMSAVSAYIIPEERCEQGKYAELIKLVKEKR